MRDGLKTSLRPILEGMGSRDFFSCIAGRVRDIVGQPLELGRLKSN